MGEVFMCKRVILLVFVFGPFRLFGSSWWTPDSDTALLVDLLGTSQQALRATMDLVEKESKILDKIEKAQMVVEEKHNRVLEAGYLFNSAAEISKNLNGVNSVSEYTGRITDLKNFKDSAKAYRDSLEISGRSNRQADTIVTDSVETALKGKKYKNKVNHKGYVGSNASTKANIDAARNSSVLVDQSASEILLLSQMYNQKRSEVEITRLEKKMKADEANGILERWGVVSSSKNASNPKSNSVSKNELVSTISADEFNSAISGSEI
jgi:hypothetical protein